MLKARRRVGLASVTIAVVAMFVLATAISAFAFAPVNSSIHGYGPTDFAQQQPLQTSASCGDEFFGHVTVDNGPGEGGEISIDKITFGTQGNCGQGISVTPNHLPCTFIVNSSATVKGFDVNITAPQGTCRYSGDLPYGAESFDGVYTVSGLVTRQSTGCGGPGQLGVSSLNESVSYGPNRNLLTP
jgi:hypothetical protein